MRVVVWSALVTVTLAACAPATTGPGGDGSTVTRSGPTLSVVLRNEPDAIIGGAAARFLIPEALFTANLAKTDRNLTPQPVLVEQVPVLNTDTWRVGPDGRMETTYRFRTGLTWHDGAPLIPEDFVFNYRRAKTFAEAGMSILSQELKSTYPGITINTNTFLSEDMGLNKFHTDRIGSPANRWSGTNRTGWSSSEFARLYGLFTGSLDRAERSAGLVGMMRLLTDELPGLTLFFNYQVLAHAAALSGPEPVAPMATAYDNVHLWEWR